MKIGKNIINVNFFLFSPFVCVDLWMEYECRYVLCKPSTSSVSYLTFMKHIFHLNRSMHEIKFNVFAWHSMNSYTGKQGINMIKA